MRKFISDMLEAGLVTTKQAEDINRFFRRRSPVELNRFLTMTERKEIARGILTSFYKVQWKDVVSKKRDAMFVRPRHVYMYVCSELLKEVLSVTGRELSGRHWSSIIHGRDRIAELINKGDEQVIEVVEEINNKLSIKK